MRNVLRLAGLLLLASCLGRPVYVEGPAVQGGIGSTPPAAMQKGGGGRVCHEIARSRCDTARCKGSGMDLVTLQCSGGQVSRCQLNKGGCR